MMTSKLYIYSYKSKSKSGQALKKSLPATMIRHSNSSFKGSDEKVVLNWGSSQISNEVLKCKILNHPLDTSLCSNKTSFFGSVSESLASLSEDPSQLLVPHTTQKEVAHQWASEGYMVVCRTEVVGSGGKGIVLAKTLEEIVDCPLYTKYIPKSQEYRVHVSRKNKTFLVQRKARKKSVTNPNWYIRNLEGGFIYSRHNFTPPDSVLKVAETVMLQGTALHFGAVDIIQSKSNSKPYVLEINTAPGLEGSTLPDYVKQIKELAEM